MSVPSFAQCSTRNIESPHDILTLVKIDVTYDETTLDMLAGTSMTVSSTRPPAETSQRFPVMTPACKPYLERCHLLASFSFSISRCVQQSLLERYRA